ncbi:MAG TPA: hypothetical protein DCM28_16555 [Phycisphaerales bacterium]|nr:hypothetical protein [Phycisphaerales bacterium]
MHALGQATQIYTSDFQEYLPHLKDPTSTPSYTVWTRSGTWFALLGGHVFNWKVKQLSVGPAEVELQGPNVIHCPSNFNDKNWNVNHYASSLRNENLRTTDILKPSARIFLLDSKSSELPVNDTNYFNYTAGYQDKWVMRHQGGANFLFLDGHAVRQPEAAFRETGNIVFKWSE